MQQRAEDRLADPSQRETGEGDSQLRRAEKGIEPLQDDLRNFRAMITAANQRVELGIADFDQREFRRYEETIEQDQRDDREDLQTRIDDRFPAHKGRAKRSAKGEGRSERWGAVMAPAILLTSPFTLRTSLTGSPRQR